MNNKIRKYKLILSCLSIFIVVVFITLFLYTNNETKDIIDRSQSYLKKTSNK